MRRWGAARITARPAVTTVMTRMTTTQTTQTVRGCAWLGIMTTVNCLAHVYLGRVFVLMGVKKGSGIAKPARPVCQLHSHVMGSVWTTVRLEHTGTIPTIKDSCARRMVSARPMTSCVDRHATQGTHIPSFHTSSVERLDLASLTMMPVLMAVVMVNSTAGSQAGVSSCQSLDMGSVGFR